mgnify:CR=1 FL=1
MSIESFCNKHKGIRRTILAFCVLWITAAVTVGLLAMLDRPLTGPDTAFLSAIIALLNVPIGFYFWRRGQEDKS